MLPLAVARRGQCNTPCSDDFVDDAMFSHNGLNKPESKTMQMFARSGNEGKVCRFRLHLVSSISYFVTVY